MSDSESANEQEETKDARDPRPYAKEVVEKVGGLEEKEDGNGSEEIDGPSYTFKDWRRGLGAPGNVGLQPEPASIQKRKDGYPYEEGIILSANNWDRCCNEPTRHEGCA